MTRKERQYFIARIRALTKRGWGDHRIASALGVTRMVIYHARRTHQIPSGITGLIPGTVKSKTYHSDGIRTTQGTEPTSTAALPGSIEKVLELCARAERGENLWHPEDAREQEG